MENEPAHSSPPVHYLLFEFTKLAKMHEEGLGILVELPVRGKTGQVLIEMGRE